MTHDFIIFLVSLDGDKDCARDIHTKCAESLVSAETNLCDNVNNFVKCYDNFIAGPTPLPTPTCTGLGVPEIIEKFDTVIDLFSKFLIKLYRANPEERMCQVDETDLDGDDCMPK